MIIETDTAGTVEGLFASVEKVIAAEQVNGLLILACDANGFLPRQVDPELQKIPVPLFGGIFPSIIHGREKLDRGTIVAGLEARPTVYTLPALSNMHDKFDATIGTLFPDTGKAKTMFVFFDGYSTGISSLLEGLYNIVGTGINYIGGGAGSINPDVLNMQHTPCLFTNKGLLQDAAIVALIELEAGVGVGHGWHKISGPYKVTESDGNAIKSLDLRPAFELYSEVIREHSGWIITRDNFFEIAKHYPFGMIRLESEAVVRDPFTVKEKDLIVATPIPQESFINILTGDTRSLLTAAKQSFVAGMESYHGGEERTVFLVDCISRVLFLDQDFPLEIEAVSEPGTPLIGILSLGEVAHSGKDYMELYNKTCVTAVLGE